MEIRTNCTDLFKHQRQFYHIILTLRNLLILNGILNKLQGKAEEVVAIHGATNNWNDIKNALLLHFGDQRDENCLNQDLVNLRQNYGESPHEFYEKIITLLNTICNYIDLKCEIELRASKRIFFTKQALKTFLAGLRDPLGPIIRAMRPNSLSQALQFIIEEDNIKHCQKSHQTNNPRKFMNSNNNQSNNSQRNNFQFSKFNQNYSNSHMTPIQRQNFVPNQQFPSNPVTIQRNTNFREPKYFSNSQVFGKPQQPKPTPMSISTSHTRQRTQPMSTNTRYLPNRQYQFYHNKPNVISEELFNTEYHNYPQCSDEQFENNEIAENYEQNFPNGHSESKIK